MWANQDPYLSKARLGSTAASPDSVRNEARHLPLHGGDAEAFELAVQRRTGDSQCRGGLDPVSVRVAEGLDDRIPLEGLHTGELSSGRVVAVTG